MISLSFPVIARGESIKTYSDAEGKRRLESP
jgi:hypothetical protein